MLCRDISLQESWGSSIRGTIWSCWRCERCSRRRTKAWKAVDCCRSESQRKNQQLCWLSHLFQKPPLFSGYEFYLHGTFGARLPRKEEMTHLIAIGGGKVLSRMPSRREAAQNLFVIVDNETLTQKAFDEIKSKDLTIVSWNKENEATIILIKFHSFCFPFYLGYGPVALRQH